MNSKDKNNGAKKPRRVFLADHFSIVRLSIIEWLRKTPDLVVCGQADNPTKALKAIRRLRPDIVVTEIFGQQDCQFIQTLHKEHPCLPILVFSFGNELWYAPRALEAGADGYLLKGVSARGLVDGIRRTLEGRVVLSPDMRYRLLMRCAPNRRVTARTRHVIHRCHEQKCRRASHELLN
jgi:DNA-binding NarL/FixJ family response regulator